MYNFINDNADFELKNPENTSFLYFPLANEAGLMSCVTPTLNGDLKSSQNTFALSPVSVMDLQNNKSSRNFWLYFTNKGKVEEGEEGEGGAWSATGQSSAQQAEIFTVNKDKSAVKAGFLWHTISRESRKYGISCETTTFIPVTGDKTELTRFTVKNESTSSVTFTPTTAIPIYGRSADNLRDHRHVTSLLHRISVNEYGVIVKPVLSFDERGHKLNNVSYGVFAAKTDGSLPQGFFPATEDFTGEGGSFENPYAVTANITPTAIPGDTIEGYEACGAARFAEITLQPGEIAEYTVAVQIIEDGESFNYEYLRSGEFERQLENNKQFWAKKSPLTFNTGDVRFGLWMKWVSFQPLLRRIFGCSFLPSHDYGRGGRGWRDLWQDCLALLLTEPEHMRDMLLNNFAGVRFDGTNATIIGLKPGEFIADRNNITRVWMDHGAWAFITVKLYIDQSGDIGFLSEKQSYFKDKQIYRGKRTDTKWVELSEQAECSPKNKKFEEISKQKTEASEVYNGTILEHLLVQHLTSFFNVGEHNNMRLDGADWNDAFDMASRRGESVAFTALYCGNLNELAELLTELQNRCDITRIPIAEELQTLIDSDGDYNYDSTSYKTALLEKYYEQCQHTLTGRTTDIPIQTLIADLTQKYLWLKNHICQNEFIRNSEGYEWFNGYYDDDADRVEGDFPSGVRMTLTGQVFPIMGGVADERHIEKVIKAADRYLYDKAVGGYRLNTNFHELKTNMGRCFGFAYGHKENGAVFSHMAVMYANALYKRGFAEAGFKVLNALYEHSVCFDTSRIYPGLPEYINGRGRGMYPYLTGSASWYILTLLTEVFGVKGEFGDLVIEPKLLKAQFGIEGNKASVNAIFAKKRIRINYVNAENKEFGAYRITEITQNGDAVEYKLSKNGKCAVIPRKFINALPDNTEYEFTVMLS